VGWTFRSLVSGRLARCRGACVHWAGYLGWSILIAEGVGLLSGVAIELLGKPWRGSVGDTLFVEGAVFLVVGGLLDFGRSITVSQLRRLGRPQDAPPPIRKPGGMSILVMAGLLLCVQGIVLGRLFAAPKG
jgi:hypothetical protein